MAWQPTTRLEISGHRFMRRRLECALLGRDPRTVNDAMRAPAQSLLAGTGLAIVLLAGCLVFAVLSPQPASETAVILMERQSGALYVRLGDTLHPALNLASARLILKSTAEPQPIAAAALSHAKLGPQLGIPGAPQFVGQPLLDDPLPWTVCDSHDGTTVIIGTEPPSAPLTGDQALLVSLSPGGPTYALFDGRRALVNPADPGVARALGLDGQAPLPVSATLLNLVPESPPIAAPRIPDAGRRGPDTLRGFPVGTVLRVARADGDEYYVVLVEGVQRVGRVAADLVRSADSRGTRTVILVAPDVIGMTKPVVRLPVSEFPDRSRLWAVPDGGMVCARWGHVSGRVAVSFSVGGPPIPAGQMPVRLVQADGPGPAVDAVYLPPGRAAYVRATSLSGADVGRGTRYLICDTGVRYAVHDNDAAGDLGLPDAMVAAPWSVLATLPAGPELSRANASVARDVPSP